MPHKKVNLPKKNVYFVKTDEIGEMPSLEKSHRSEISGQKALCVSICYACHPKNVQHVSKHKIWRKKQKKKTAERERTAWCPPNLTHKNASETTKRPCISSVKICLFCRSQHAPSCGSYKRLTQPFYVRTTTASQNIMTVWINIDVPTVLVLRVGLVYDSFAPICFEGTY